jgi:hypothetical protein
VQACLVTRLVQSDRLRQQDAAGCFHGLDLLAAMSNVCFEHAQVAIDYAEVLDKCLLGRLSMQRPSPVAVETLKQT